MNASWMLGATIVTILFAFAAMLLEPVVALYRRMPLRAVWIAAAVGAVAISAFRLMPGRAAIVVPPNETGDGQWLGRPDIDTGRGNRRASRAHRIAWCPSSAKSNSPQWRRPQTVWLV